MAAARFLRVMQLILLILDQKLFRADGTNGGVT